VCLSRKVIRTCYLHSRLLTHLVQLWSSLWPLKLGVQAKLSATVQYIIIISQKGWNYTCFNIISVSLPREWLIAGKQCYCFLTWRNLHTQFAAIGVQLKLEPHADQHYSPILACIWYDINLEEKSIMDI